MITGESAVGKSELGLELISRGSGLVADDIVELHRIAPDTLEGRCPELLRDFLEVRGLGILNVRAMFGDTAVRPEKTLRLIVRLDQLNPEQMAKVDRLQVEQKTRNILDVDIPEVVLFVAPGRNLAVLVEAATRNHILRMRGVNPLEELMERQHVLMSQKDK
jgi:HPr kinase/phosphorylase